jgi:hypothetical protein
MTTGLSGTFAFNGTNLNQYPTEHGWAERTNYGIDGNAHPIYSQNRSYQMTWNLISTEDAKQIIDYYNLVGNTGTLTACLPEWGNVGYSFRNFSGTTLMEPTYSGYYMGYLLDFKLLILNVNTNQ